MLIKKKIRGICHWWDSACLIRSIGRRIDISTDNGTTFSTVCHLDYRLHQTLASTSRLGARLFRTNPKHIIKLTPELFLVFAAGSIYQLNIATKTAIAVASIHGSRPLRVAFDGTSVFYGQYFSNPDRDPVCLYQSSDFGHTWKTCHEFRGIRHIHGVFFDAQSSSIWITTGDYQDEAAIWKADSEFNDVHRVLSGSQQSRTIDLLFAKDRVYFGTDAPEEQNWVYSMLRDGSNLQRVSKMNGPVFHATRIAEDMYFSTACEPAESTTYTHAELVKINGSTAHQIRSLKKDLWSMRYFQYGQISMPDGPGIEGQLWYSPYACEDDQFSVLVECGR